MTTSVRFNLDQGAISQLMLAPSGTVQTYLRRTAEVAADSARRRAPVMTGQLQRSIVVRRGALGSWEVSAETPYAYVVHEGTGKKSAPPKRIRRGGGVQISVKKKASGKGATGQPFLMDALRDAVGSLT